MDIHLRHEVDRVIAAGGTRAAGLANELMVDYLVARGFVRSPALEEALRRQPRHRFLPDHDPRVVYQDRAVTTALDGEGWFDSSCSTPSIVCLMTEALAIEPSSRVLEIGAGTGWTAALMAELASAQRIVSLEVLPELAAAARTRLERRLPGRVDLRCADGSGESAGPGPYDRIVFACGAEELPVSALDLLDDGGRLVIPLGQFIHRFERRGHRLVGRPLATAAFIAHRGGRPRRSWVVTEGRAVLGDRARAGCLRELDPGLAELVAGPELDPGALAGLQYLSGHRAGGGDFLMVERGRGWGFGLLGPGDRTAAAILVPTEFMFRHYDGAPVPTRIAVWGGPEAGEALLAAAEELAGLGWPALGDLEVEVEIGAAAGGTRWSLATPARLG